MFIPGRVQNGVVIPDSVSAPPEGAIVTITYPALNGDSQPGSVRLTGEAIAETLDNEDASRTIRPETISEAR